MKTALYFTVSLLLAVAALAEPPAGYTLTWSDEFDGDKLDVTKWDYRTDSKHWSTQTPANVTVSDGFLSLGVKKEAQRGKQYTGSGVISKRLFKYGYYEAKFRVPPGAGWHTSFWLMKYDSNGGTGTKGANQEIDICEQDSVNLGAYSLNLHDWENKHRSYGHKRVKTEDLSAAKHVWGCEFTPKHIRYYFDGKLVQQLDATWLNHGDHNIWLTSIASHLGRTKAVDDSKLPSAAVFDYVRFYEKNALEQAARQEDTYTLESDIPYYNESVIKTDPYIEKLCKLDIYYPNNRKAFATLVWFHGGGLTGGKKRIPEALKEQGICIVAVDYRLYPQVKSPKYIEDAAAAVAWVFNNIENYGGNASRIFISGHSAGGYLTSMVGLDKRWLATHKIDANRIAGLIPLSGHTITHFTVRKERGIPGTRPVVDELAPLYHVRADAPPLLLITGDREKEMLGRYEENAYMMRMMKVSGHKDTSLVELKGYGHGIVKPAIPLVLRELQRIVEEKHEQYRCERDNNE